VHVEEAMKAQMVGRSIALTLLHPGKRTVPILQQTEWALRVVQMDAENIILIGIDPPDHPACSNSLYQLCSNSPLIVNTQSQPTNTYMIRK
jgi:hypothetical protein